MHRVFMIAIVFAAGGAGFAEELLVKPNGAYLGKSKSSTQFEICNGGIVDVEPGTVQSTSRKCPNPFVMGPVDIRGVNRNSVTIRDENSNDVVFELSAEELRRVGSLVVGGRLTITTTGERFGVDGASVVRTFSLN